MNSNKKLGIILIVFGIILTIISITFLIIISVNAIINKKLTFYPILLFIATIISSIVIFIGIFIKNGSLKK